MAGVVELVVSVSREWGIQVLVLLSLALQVILLITAEIRRVKDSGVVRAVVWSAYLLADSTAIYALGHMSVTSRSREHQLMVFWAPFLLLHLGGQDNITAYALEDNRLWLRHLQLLSVQVAGVAYVLHESSTLGSASSIRSATVLVFVVGVLKYGERVWALKCASASNEPGNYLPRGHSKSRVMHFYLSAMERPDTEDLLWAAHRLLYVAEHFLERPASHATSVTYCLGGCQVRENLFRLVEMQMSLMHDALYSKAEVMRTSYGLCIRMFSPASIATAFLLFHRSGLSDSDHRNGYSRADVAVAYALLVGAIVLETAALVRAMFSIWVMGSRKIFIWRKIVPRLRRLLLPERRRWWSESMGQHNLFDLLERRKSSRSSRIAKLIGLEDRWNTIAYSRSIPVSPKMKDLLVELLFKLSNARLEKANEIIYKALGLPGAEMKFDESIVVWHIATDVYLRWLKDQEQQGKKDQQQDLVEAIEALSNYMLFLLVSRPYMLPGFASRSYYSEMCHYLGRIQVDDISFSTEDLVRSLQGYGTAMNKGLIYSRHQPRYGSDNTLPTGNETLDRGCQLGAKLIGKGFVGDMGSQLGDVQDLHGLHPDDIWELKGDALDILSGDRLKLIAEVWGRMLFDAGYRCGVYAHAKQLSNGGELLTVAALLIAHCRTSWAWLKENEPANRTGGAASTANV